MILRPSKIISGPSDAILRRREMISGPSEIISDGCEMTLRRRKIISKPSKTNLRRRKIIFHRGYSDVNCVFSSATRVAVRWRWGRGKLCRIPRFCKLSGAQGQAA
jgi:hypothetical protein